jgi:4-hydroxy-tetrahydrodipicolinate synthase
MNVSWRGIFPAVTTKFKQDLSLDAEATRRHISLMIDSGAEGIVVLGSLGENGTLTAGEKTTVIRAALEVADGKVPVLSCVADSSTAAAAAFVRESGAMGLAGFMVLPPMRYRSDERETIAHYKTIAAASDRPVMVYNNPIAYGVDVTPEMFARLAADAKFAAIKESSGDVRRITDIRNICGTDRYAIFAGVDDLAYESFLLGAAGWVAGLVCAFPAETVALYKLIRASRFNEALAIYRWFMPLLHLDTHMKFVQYIKLAESITGTGSEHVRPPRLPLEGDERAKVTSVVRAAIESRPALPKL